MGKLIIRWIWSIESGPSGFEAEPAQGTGSDRKYAKGVIPDTLGTRLPWRVTLSSSDPVPCALSFFVAARTTLIRVCQQFEADNSVIRFFLLLQRGQRSVIIRLSGDFINQLAVDHFIVLIQHNYGTCGQTFQRTIGNFHAIIIFKL